MRHVVITGAGAGLGRVTAAKFAEAGDRVYGCDVSPRAVDELRNSKSAAYAEVVDVSDRSQIDRFFDVIWSMTDKIDVLINNVGVAGPKGRLEDIDPDDWLGTINANLNAAFWSMRRVLAPMKLSKSGTILNISTFSVRTHPEQRAPYIVSKAALESLTKTIAREAGPYNIRCNAVQPGAMDNDRLTQIFLKIAADTGQPLAEVEREQLKFISMRTKVSMTEVASLLFFLASDDAIHITSQIIAIDGGAQWES